MTARLWLIFFCEPTAPAWWARLLRPGFRHVYAVSWFDDQERWVEFNPDRRGTVLRLWKSEDFNARLAGLLAETTVVLRVASRQERGNAPALAFCIGEIKALLGIRSWALTPHGLYRDLRRRGAEVVYEQGSCVGSEQEAAAPSAP